MDNKHLKETMAARQYFTEMLQNKFTGSRFICNCLTIFQHKRKGSAQLRIMYRFLTNKFCDTW